MFKNYPDVIRPGTIWKSDFKIQYYNNGSKRCLYRYFMENVTFNQAIKEAEKLLDKYDTVEVFEAKRPYETFEDYRERKKIKYCTLGLRRV